MPARKGKLVTFGDDGEAYINGAPPDQGLYTKAQIANLAGGLLSTPYVMKANSWEEWLRTGQTYSPEERAKDGMSMAEAMYYELSLAAARGEVEAAKFITDRYIGKPKQQIEADINVTMTLEGYLEKLADEDDEQPVILEDQQHVIDVSECFERVKDLGV